LKKAFTIPGLFCLIFLKIAAADSSITLQLKSEKDRAEVEKLITGLKAKTASQRIEQVSAYLLGRKYHPDTKKRIKKQRTKKTKNVEANNIDPLPVKLINSDLRYLDCMTYVEHVLALAACQKPDYKYEFLLRLIDIKFNANGRPLMNHHRKHFTSVWADRNEAKGYVKNVAKAHPLAQQKVVTLNKVGKNRTFYVKDRFMISEKPQTVWYFSRDTLLKKEIKLESGDIIAMVTGKEGLDVTHMGFYIEKDNKPLLRHASYTKNEIVDEDFYEYFKNHKSARGIMLLRPVLNASSPARYRFKVR
jgi:hypothetical protein